jgi:hypothetical protein
MGKNICVAEGCILLSNKLAVPVFVFKYQDAVKVL